MKYLLIAITLFGIGCAKDKSCENCQDNNKDPYKNATVVFGGPVATDGCGWLIKIDATHTYHPDALNVAFQQDQLPVKIDYELTTDQFICGVAGLHITTIHVKDIKL
ncbi:MAG: hypothetical protein ABI416_11675 [Ginsengibacter sp.]